MQTREFLDEETLIKIAGGLEFGYVEDEYKGSNLLYPERCWRINGIDFTIDVYDEGNGWYSLLKYKVKR